MRDWCSECQFANYGGSQEPCYNCITAYNKKPSEFTPATDGVRGVGKWEKDSDGLDVCSECGEIALQRVFIKLPYKIVDLKMICSNYCPNCGAKMEVKE